MDEKQKSIIDQKIEEMENKSKNKATTLSDFSETNDVSVREVDMAPSKSVQYEPEIEVEKFVDIPKKLEGIGSDFEVDRNDFDPHKHNSLMAGMLEQQKIADEAREKLEELTKPLGGLHALAEIGERKSGLENSGLVEIKPSDNDIDTILAEFESDASRNELGITDPEDIELILEKMEAGKIYAEDQKVKDEYNGPADYVIIESEEFTSTISDVLSLDDYKLKNRSGKERTMLLEKFANSGNEVGVTFVNSGLWMNFCGISTTEIISMNSTQDNDPVVTALNKFQQVFKHVTNSNIGKISLKHGIKLISYYDIDTLFYGLYVATNPEESEIMRTCDKCEKEFYAKLLSRNLLLNGDEFIKASDYIKHTDTLGDMLANSDLNKEYVKKHDFGIIVHYRHPSIGTFLTVARTLTNENKTKYPELTEMCYNISKILIPVPNTESDAIAYTDPNEIIEVLASLRKPEYRYDIIDMIEMIRPHEVPEYGFEAVKCPHCSHENEQHALNIQTLLFLQARQEEEKAMMKWSATQQKKKKKK